MRTFLNGVLVEKLVSRATGEKIYRAVIQYRPLMEAKLLRKKFKKATEARDYGDAALNLYKRLRVLKKAEVTHEE